MGTVKEKFPHPVLAPWLKEKGPGAMTRLVKDTGKTWATIDRIVWKGVMPRGDTALLLARATGATATEIIEGSRQCQAQRDSAA